MPVSSIKCIRIFVVVVASLAVLGFAGRYFVEWSLNRSLFGKPDLIAGLTK